MKSISAISIGLMSLLFAVASTQAADRVPAAGVEPVAGGAAAGRRGAAPPDAVLTRAHWPRGSPCAKPQALIMGQPGVRIELTVTFEAERRHLPVVTLRRVA